MLESLTVDSSDIIDGEPINDNQNENNMSILKYETKKATPWNYHSIVATILLFNPLLDYSDLVRLTYEELEELRETERLNYNKRLKSNKKVLENL
jgi:hypothetical protein